MNNFLNSPLFYKICIVVISLNLIISLIEGHYYGIAGQVLALTFAYEILEFKSKALK